MMRSNMFFYLIFLAYCLGHAWSPTILDCIHHPNAKNISIQCQTWHDKLRIQIYWSGFYQDWDNTSQSFSILTPETNQNSKIQSYKVPYTVYFIAIPYKEQELPQFLIEDDHQIIFDHLPTAVMNMPPLYAPSPPINKDCSSSWHDSYNFPQETTSLCCQEQSTSFISLYFVEKGKNYNILALVVRPLTYNPTHKQLIVHDFIQCTLTLKQSLWSEVDLTHSNIAKIWAQTVIAPPAPLLKEEDIPEEYLVIAADSLALPLEPLLAHRRKEGFVVTLKTVSDVKAALHSSGLLSASQLRDFLVLYYNQVPCLTYVLLVGDVEFIPVKYQDDDGTDFFYSTLDDTGDFFPDVYLGRLPANNASDVEAMVDKIIAYEQAAPSKKILLASFLQDSNLDGISDRDYVQFSEQFRDYLVKREYECFRAYTKTPGSSPLYYRDNTPIPYEITFDSSINDIVRTINSGIALVSHRDHGNPTGWDHPAFCSSDLSLLSNKRYPLMINVDCSTGQFDQETQAQRKEIESSTIQMENESFSEQLLSLRERGMASIIAPTRMTNNTVNDIFHRGLMGAIWPNMFHISNAPASRLGQVLYRGRIQVLRELGDTGIISDKIRENFRQYHILGDPALLMRQPQ